MSSRKAVKMPVASAGKRAGKKRPVKKQAYFLCNSVVQL